MSFFKRFKMKYALTRASIIHLLMPFKPGIEHAASEQVQKFDQNKFKKKENGKKEDDEKPREK